MSKTASEPDEWGPHVVQEDSIQQAWLETVRLLMARKWELRNLIVSIRKPFDTLYDVHNRYERLCNDLGILNPRHVAYTIFPASFATGKTAESLFDAYNRSSGLFHRISTKWGTYFRRLTHYDSKKAIVNQLERVVTALKRDKAASKAMSAAYTMILQEPGGETTKPRGGPCLNYLALQVEKGNPSRIGLLAVYRNHDFLAKAYGNYIGLANLLQFICNESGYSMGPLTCISSHAYIDSHKRALTEFLEALKP